MNELVKGSLSNYMDEWEWLRTIRHERLRVRHSEQDDTQPGRANEEG